jgi:hypothetical protein
MSPELTGVIIGGVIGIVSSLLAVFLSHSLQRSRDDERYVKDKNLMEERFQKDMTLVAWQRIDKLLDDGASEDDHRITYLCEAFGIAFNQPSDAEKENAE